MSETAPSNSLIPIKLPAKKLSALRALATERGLTTEQYVKELIENSLVPTPRRPSFAELTVPFQKAFGHLSEPELDAMVDAARKRRRRRLARQRKRR